MPASIFRRNYTHFIELGYSPLARFKNGDRDSWPKAWSDYCQAVADIETLKKWAAIPGAMIALACGFGGLVVIDVDTDEIIIKARILKALPHCRMARFGSKGFALFARYEGPGECRFSNIYSGEGITKKPLIEVKGLGQNITVPPSIHAKTGQEYYWLNPETGDKTKERPALAELPIFTDDDLRRLRDAVKQWTTPPRPIASHTPRPDSFLAKAKTDTLLRKRYSGYYQAALRNAQTALSNAREGRPTMLFRSVCALGAGVHHDFIPRVEFESVFLNACATNGLMGREGRHAILATINSGIRCSVNDDLPDIGETISKKRTKRQGNGFDRHENGSGGSNGSGGGHDIDEGDGPKPKPNEDEDGEIVLTESEISHVFASENAETVRYVEKWNKWALFDGKVWQTTGHSLAYNRIHKLVRRISLSAKKRLKTVEKNSFVSGAVNLARYHDRILASPDQWDANRWLLNTPGGIYDLRTGACRPARPDDYCMMITGVAPDPNCPTDNWLEFLNTISNEDQDWINYMQRVFGYLQTGSVREHALFFGWGTGTNGKGTLVQALAGIMGDYCSSAPVELFMASKVDRHPTELARLQFTRAVTCGETHRHRRWDDTKIKALTGGDKITARFMRQDDFEFWPQFKLFISGNYKPRIQSPDEAMRRRMNLVPFSVTIPDEQKDLDLFEKKLKPELPGILSWAIRGAREWFEEGLKPPELVRNATREYLSEEDSYAIWLSDCTERKSARSWTNSTALFDCWRAWAERRNEDVGTSKALSTYLKDHAEELKIKEKRKPNGRGFSGIAIKEGWQSQPEFELDREENDDLGF